MSIASNQKNDNSATEIQFQRGRLYYNTGKFNEALIDFHKALNEYEEAGNQRGVANTRASIGEVLRARGDFEQAMQAFQDALEIYQGIGDQVGIALTKKGIGSIKALINKTSDGLEDIGAAIQILDQAGARPYQARAYLDYGVAISKINNPSAAKGYLEDHWEFINQYATGITRADAFAVRAMIKAELGDIAGSVQDTKEALSFYRERGVHTGLAKEVEELAAAIPVGQVES